MRRNGARRAPYGARNSRNDYPLCSSPGAQARAAWKTGSAGRGSCGDGSDSYRTVTNSVHNLRADRLVLLGESDGCGFSAPVRPTPGGVQGGDVGVARHRRGERCRRARGGAAGSARASWGCALGPRPTPVTHGLRLATRPLFVDGSALSANRRGSLLTRSGERPRTDLRRVCVRIIVSTKPRPAG